MFARFAAFDLCCKIQFTCVISCSGAQLEIFFFDFFFANFKDLKSSPG